jgi:hypothetical protein
MPGTQLQILIEHHTSNKTWRLYYNLWVSNKRQVSVLEIIIFVVSVVDSVVEYLLRKPFARVQGEFKIRVGRIG